MTKFQDKFASLRLVNSPYSWNKFQVCCTDMYLIRFLPNFAVFFVFLWISRLRDRAKYQKPCLTGTRNKGDLLSCRASFRGRGESVVADRLGRLFCYTLACAGYYFGYFLWGTRPRNFSLLPSKNCRLLRYCTSCNPWCLLARLVKLFSFLFFQCEIPFSTRSWIFFILLS